MAPKDNAQCTRWENVLPGWQWSEGECKDELHCWAQMKAVNTVLQNVSSKEYTFHFDTKLLELVFQWEAKYIKKAYSVAAVHGDSMYVYMNHGTEPCMHVYIKKVWTPTSCTQRSATQS